MSPTDRPHVLVVDDMQNTRLLVRLLLEKQFNADVSEAPDGLGAVTVAIKKPPDLVVSDVAMPRMNGLELVKSLREMPQLADVPIILLTSKGEQVYRTRAAMLKVQDYLVKPFSPTTFMQLLSRYLQARRLVTHGNGGGIRGGQFRRFESVSGDGQPQRDTISPAADPARAAGVAPGDEEHAHCSRLDVSFPLLQHALPPERLAYRLSTGPGQAVRSGDRIAARARDEDPLPLLSEGRRARPQPL